jgi:hypothetical protein
MSQDGAGVDLETSLGYLLKQASSALHSALEAVLRPLGMSVTHYSCMELLSQRPGLSNSELARGAFVFPWPAAFGADRTLPSAQAVLGGTAADPGARRLSGLLGLPPR